MMLTNQSLIDEILEAFTAQGVDATCKKLNTFIQTFVAQIPAEDLVRLGRDSTSRLIYSVWNLIQTRQATAPKHRVYKWIPDTDSVVVERLVIDLVNVNRPFLVDSLTGLLRKHGLKAHILLHPIFLIERDEDGTLIEISAPNQAHKKQENKTYESVIHCQIRDDFNVDIIKKIREELPSMLEDIRLATQDWMPMKDKMRQMAVFYQQDDSHAQEMQKFLDWLRDQHFTFLGYCAYDVGKAADGTMTTIPQNALGIMTNTEAQDFSILFEGIVNSQEAETYLLDNDDLIINKSSRVSSVHRCVPMDVVGVKQRSADGTVTRIHMFVGLFTSEAYDSSARDIPLLRQKVAAIVEEVGYSTDWHDGKALVHVLDSLPRDELLQTTTKELAEIGQRILSLKSGNTGALFVRKDKFSRFLSCLVYIPRERFGMHLSTKMCHVIAQHYGTDVSLVKAQFGDFAFARLHYRVSLVPGAPTSCDAKSLEAKLMDITQSWEDSLRRAYYNQHDERISGPLIHRYVPAFPQAYRDTFSVAQAQKDVDDIEIVISTQQPRAQIYSASDETQMLNLKLFNPANPMPLSNILPTLENLGMHVVSEVPYQITPKGVHLPIWLHNFSIVPDAGHTLNKAQQENFLEMLSRIWAQKTEDDRFNVLILNGRLSWRECTLMRAYGRYLHQLRTPYSWLFAQGVLARHGSFVKTLANLFSAHFDPAQNTGKAAVFQKQAEKYFDTVVNAEEDQVLRLFFNLVQATVRTNYFQTDAAGNPKPYISLKFDCCKIYAMPLPRPLYEIFVHGPDVEGVHMRAGKVARGGLRWSDRYEDYRTEILGLMKAQIVKNTVIVPTGSKGGFVIKKSLEGLSQEARQDAVVLCYQTFIRGLLDITDNIKFGKTVSPLQTRCLDAEDAYLVVAADKGTATFSDFANAVSLEYGFWLGDAFASGGSVGYDHKKMGITARGAWASVQHHFYGLDIDIQKEPITVVGVGDMSGDVFGNGMLLSPHLKVIAAFNHLHIFFDPRPDPAVSFKERQRLFDMPRSNWSDYDTALLSKGGGVFERSAKIIQLTPEMRAFLKTTDSELSPNAVIRLLLQANVDLLWFGGIGTYVKSTQQSHEQAGDRANDAIRVDGKMLRCKVIGEGANLGVTQEARIEYAKNGGCLNTDFIDNSAGVDTSDHEVNLKILAQQLIASSALVPEKRDAFLSALTDEVGMLVLEDNKKQNMVITMIEEQGHHLVDAQASFIRTLEAEGILNRQLENLPDDVMISEYAQTKQGFVRPELSILISYAKLSLKQKILETTLVDDPYCDTALLAYFPASVAQTYADAIRLHPLRRELVATYLVNEIVNRMGAAFLHDLMDKTGHPIEDCFKAYFIVHELISLAPLWQTLDGLCAILPRKTIIMLHHHIWRVIQRMVLWFLRSPQQVLDLQKTSHEFQSGITEIVNNLEHCLAPQHQASIKKEVKKLEKSGVPTAFAKQLSHLSFIVSFPEIIVLAQHTKTTVLDAATTYLRVGVTFDFEWLRACLDTIPSIDNWHNLALNLVESDLYLCQSMLTSHIINFGHDQKDDRLKTEATLGTQQEELIARWCTTRKRRVYRLNESLERAKTLGEINLAFLTVVVQQMRQLL